METIGDLKDFLKGGHVNYRPSLSIDSVIFGYHEGELQVLLLRSKIITMWALPGGYVLKSETLEQAASRITEQRTGIPKLFLQQFRAFSNPERNHNISVDLNELTQLLGKKLPRIASLEGPTVTIGFYAISDVINAKPKHDFLSTECKWFPISSLPKLAFDHNEIVHEALAALRIHLYHFPIGKNLLPSKFTLKEIKGFYEAMSGKQLNATNFPNKLIALGLIRKTNEKLKIGAHRSPTYYCFNDVAYEKALKEGLVLA